MIFKLLAMLIMLVALYLLYRLAYPKQAGNKREGASSPEIPKTDSEIMGKSRFVYPVRSKPPQTAADSQKNEKVIEKENTFAAQTEGKRSAEIPAEKLDEVFGENSGNAIMSIPLENVNDDYSEIDFEAEEAEEAEELRKVLGEEPMFADGFEFDALVDTVKAVNEQPETVSEQTAGTLVKLEHTDMFEWLASGSEDKMNWIKAVIERNIQKIMPEIENTITETTEYEDFNIQEFLF